MKPFRLMEIRVGSMNLFINPFSGGSHKNNMGYRVNGQVGDQILIIDAPVHAADENGADGRDAF